MLQVKVEFKVKRKRHMMHIGEVARSAGVRASAIRYYEARGIIRPAVRSLNGYRFYRDDAVGLLAFVKRAQSLGLTLNEIKSLLELNCNDRSRCRQAKQLAREHVRQINETIVELQRLRRELRALVRRKVRQPDKISVCPLIERKPTAARRKIVHSPAADGARPAVSESQRARSN
jgi:MerR family copper efflux transcriptional regulator